MPPLPRLKTPALAHIAQQLRFAPKPAARRHVVNLERLALNLDPAATYPAEWLLFQITAARTALPDDALLPGDVLLRDLPALIHRLCLRAAFTRDELLAQHWLDQPAACARLHITPRSLQRFQRQGLLSRRALSPVRGSWTTLFLPASIDRFLTAPTTAPRTPARKPAPTRIAPAIAARLVRTAARASSRFGWSIATCARKLAAKHARSPEGLRQLLLRAVKRRELAPPPTTLSARQRRVILRADRLAIDHTRLARRFAKSTSAIERALLIARAARLRAIPFQALIAHGLITAPASKSHDALLQPPTVRSGLGAGRAADPLDFLRDIRESGWPDPAIELARAKAYVLLIARAAFAIHALKPIPSPLDVDEIETSLRWSARIKVELVRSQLMMMLRTLEVQLARPPDSLPPALLVPLLTLAINALAQGVDRFDPFNRGRLAAPSGLELNRAVARWAAAHAEDLAPAPVSPPLSTPSRRATRTTPVPTEAITLPDWTLSVSPWQIFLEPATRIRRALQHPAFVAPAHLLLAARQHLALLGETPHTIRQIARSLQLPPNLAARRVKETLRLAARWSPPA